MRHRKKGRKLNRTTSHRKATLANLAAALFERKRIKTTHAKAKEASRFSEKIITLAKRGDLHSRRLALARLRNKRVVKLLFDEIAPRFMERKGGYTRVIKIGQRASDGAPMSILELVGYEGVIQESKKGKKAAKAEEAE